MLVVNRSDRRWRDSLFTAFPDHLRAGDVLVLNNTRVFPARLIGRRVPTGGSVEILLLRELQPAVWQVLARPARRPRAGSRVGCGLRSQAEGRAAYTAATRLRRANAGR